MYGAGTRNRTRDLLITSQLLYQLSYTGKGRHYSHWQRGVNRCDAVDTWAGYQPRCAYAQSRGLMRMNARLLCASSQSNITCCF
ncbi:hypothetical protein PSEUDO8AS_50190 [Pseudomonas sp. 8AS]|nr:hypothetical protein PSEUDO8AS_50190 [Pseudomonas sp. 8AS]